MSQGRDTKVGGNNNSAYLRKAAQIESRGPDIGQNMSSFLVKSPKSVGSATHILAPTPDAATPSEFSFGGSYEVGEAVSLDLFFKWFKSQVGTEGAIHMEEYPVQGFTPTGFSPTISPTPTMSGSEKVSRWQGRRLEDSGDGTRKYGQGGEIESTGKKMKATNATADVSRVAKVDKMQRSRSLNSRQVAVPGGKGIDSKSAAKVYSLGVRLANLKSPQGGKERGRGTIDADSSTPQSEDGKVNASTLRKQSRSSRTDDEHKPRSTSRPSSPRVNGLSEVAEASAPRKSSSVKPVVVRAKMKASEGTRTETPKAVISRDHRGCGGVMDEAPREEADAIRRVYVAPGKFFGGAEEDKLRSDSPEIALVIKVEGVKSSQVRAGQASVVSVRNPIWPVAYEQHKLTSKIPDTLPEVPPQISVQLPRTSENENKCPGDVKQAGGGKEKLGVDVDNMASHLNWHLPGEASTSPKSVLDRAQSSSPESTEDESMELGLSAAELKYLKGMAGPTDVSNYTPLVASSSASSAESLEFASLSFMGEAEGMEPDLEYVRQILVSSRFGGSDMPEWHSDSLAVNPTLFEQLEKGMARGSAGEVPGVGRGQGSVEQQRRQEERRQRMLLFDAVNEALVRRLLPYKELPVWQKRAKVTIKPRPSGRQLLQEVWSEIHDWPAPSSEEVYDILDDAARRDMVKGSYKWDEFGAEEVEVVCTLEKAILEGLMEEVIREFGETEKKRRARRGMVRNN